MKDAVRLIAFPDPETLAGSLADDIAGRLRAALTARGSAVLAVSGGTTPKRFFERLSDCDLDWASVVVTLVDERFVSTSSDRSNEGLVRKHLLRNRARLARFVGLRGNAAEPEAAAGAASAALALFGGRLDVAILGMGTDGHTASYFPDAPDLDRVLDPAATAAVMAVHAETAGEPRLSLSLPILVDAGHLALHIEGKEKREVLERALHGPPLAPVARVIAAAPHPLAVYWAPAKEERP